MPTAYPASRLRPVPPRRRPRALRLLIVAASLLLGPAVTTVAAGEPTRPADEAEIDVLRVVPQTNVEPLPASVVEVPTRRIRIVNPLLAQPEATGRPEQSPGNTSPAVAPAASVPAPTSLATLKTPPGESRSTSQPASPVQTPIPHSSRRVQRPLPMTTLATPATPPAVASLVGGSSKTASPGTSGGTAGRIAAMRAELNAETAPVVGTLEADPAVEKQYPVKPVQAVEAAAPPRGAALTALGLKPMSQLSADLGDEPLRPGDVPVDQAKAWFDEQPVIAQAEYVGRDWAITDYRWEASMLCHRPLLFEHLNAERYGITYGCLQPVVSGAHFFATVPALPYKIWANGHDHCQYALGYYRPGSYAVPQRYRLRVSADASLFETAIILGLIFALP